MAELKVISPEKARAIHWLGSRATFFAMSAETDSAYAIWMDEPPPGGGPIPHVHTREEEFFYVLEGNLTFWCAGQEFKATPGAFIGLPKGLGHQFRNEGDGPSRTLIFLVPWRLRGFFPRNRQPVLRTQRRHGPTGPQTDRRGIGEVWAEGRRPVAPPPATRPVIRGPTARGRPLADSPRAGRGRGVRRRGSPPDAQGRRASDARDLLAHGN